MTAYGRWGAAAYVRRTTTRMTMSIGLAVLVVMAPVMPLSTASASSSDRPPPDRTALILGTSGVPTPDDFYVETVKHQFIAPTHPGQDINYVKVTTPEEL
ncbi:hypothetical protein ACGFK1_32175 [Mycobacterium sp. NPDC048908]|uniref:hypothetical protein n=1 Tax=Mycobacterium sp. NPDC048908 TaxID=3364292 RepID=UPI00371B1D0F